MLPKRTIFRDLRNDTRLSLRFWGKLSKDVGSCWLWTAYRDAKGYGKVIIEKRVHYAHRIAWELTNGPIPSRLLVLHRCDIPACCNPEHLFLGTQGDNMKDMWTKGRHVPPNRRATAKLTVSDVIRIRELAATGMYQYVIAKQFGVSQTNVGQIVRRATWADV